MMPRRLERFLRQDIDNACKERSCNLFLFLLQVVCQMVKYNGREKNLMSLAKPCLPCLPMRVRTQTGRRRDLSAVVF